MKPEEIILLGLGGSNKGGNVSPNIPLVPTLVITEEEI